MGKWWSHCVPMNQTSTMVMKLTAEGSKQAGKTAVFMQI